MSDFIRTVSSMSEQIKEIAIVAWTIFLVMFALTSLFFLNVRQKLIEPEERSRKTKQR